MRTILRAGIACLTAAMLAAVVGLIASPAHATIQVTDCWKYDDGQYGAKICMDVNYRRDADGVGIWFDAVRIYATGDLNPVFESKIEDCDNLRLWNNDSVVKWRKDDGQCDLFRSDAGTIWYPGVHLSRSDGHVGWSFYPKLDFARDPGYTHLHLDLTN